MSQLPLERRAGGEGMANVSAGRKRGACAPMGLDEFFETLMELGEMEYLLADEAMDEGRAEMAP